MAGNRDVYEQALNEGNSAAWDQQWDTAINAYARALEEFPDDSSVLNSLGLALLAKNMWEQALAVYQRAAQLNADDPLPLEKCAEILHRMARVPEAAQAFYFAAEAYVAKRDVNKAIENWTRSASLAPDNLQAHTRLALAYERTGRSTDASHIYVAVARILQRQGEMQKALQSAQRGAQLDPRNQAALQAVEFIQRGAPVPEGERPRPSTGSLAGRAAGQSFVSEAFAPKVKESGGKVAGAKENPLEEARQRAVVQLADLMFEFGDVVEDPADAANVLKRATADPFRNVKSNNRLQLMGLLTQAIDLQAKGDRTAALSFFEKILRGGMEHAALNILLGGGYFDGERYKEAAKQFQVATANPAYAAGAFYGVGLCHGREERLKEAVINLLRSLQYVDLGTVSAGQADSLSAMYESFEENLGNGQSNDDLNRIAETLIGFLSGSGWLERVRQARVQLNAQQENGALVPLAEMISIPGADRVMESIALIERYSAKQNYAAALDEAQRAVEYSPTYLPVHMKMADILVKEGHVEAAIEKYTVSAELYRIRGDEGRAIRIFQQIANLAPMDVNIRTRLSQMYTAQGNAPEAIRQIVESADIHITLADLEMARQTLNSALLLAQKPGVNPGLALAVLHKIGDLDMQRLDLRQAVKTFEQIKGLNPSDDTARVALIQLYFRLANPRQALAETDDTLRHFLPTAGLPKSIEILEAVLAEQPADANIRQRLARLYQQAGRKADAIAQLDAVADLFHQSGSPAEAARIVQAIIAMEPDNVDDYRQLLTQLQSSA